jgi:hypothetical protein
LDQGYSYHSAICGTERHVDTRFLRRYRYGTLLRAIHTSRAQYPSHRLMPALEMINHSDPLHLQSIQIGNRDSSTLDFNQPLWLQSAQIAGNEFAHSADLRSDLLIILRQGNFNFAVCAHALAIGESGQKCTQPVPHGRKWKLLNDSDQPSQSRTYDAQYLQGYLRMSQAQLLKIPLAYEKQGSVFDRCNRGRIIAAVKNRQFGDWATGAVNA